MRVEITNMRRFPWCRFPVAQVHTAVGHTAVPWHGAEDAPPGSYYVEWTVDKAFTWGLDAEAATDPRPGILAGGHCVILRGLLHHAPDAASVLDLAGSMILVDFATPPPAEIDRTWVQLHIAHQHIGLHPYTL